MLGHHSTAAVVARRTAAAVVEKMECLGRTTASAACQTMEAVAERSMADQAQLTMASPPVRTTAAVVEGQTAMPALQSKALAGEMTVSEAAMWTALLLREAAVGRLTATTVAMTSAQAEQQSTARQA